MPRRRPTPEEEQKLSKIVNRRQREALLRAIAQGEEIPDFAWTPIPELTEEQERKLDELMRPVLQEMVDMALRGIDVMALLSDVGRDLETEESRTSRSEQEEVEIDLDFRPETYWPGEPDERVLLSRIKGVVRRRLAAEVLERGDDASAVPELFAEALHEEARRDWGRLHPCNLGGEFLPDLEPDEVEVARIELASTTADVISFRARRTGDGLRYRVVNEYGLDQVLREGASADPLSLRELVELIDGTGIIEEVLEMNFGDDPDPERTCAFVLVSSPFYPGLSEHYRRWVARWCASRGSSRGGSRG